MFNYLKIPKNTLPKKISDNIYYFKIKDKIFIIKTYVKLFRGSIIRYKLKDKIPYFVELDVDNNQVYIRLYTPEFEEIKKYLRIIKNIKS